MTIKLSREEARRIAVRAQMLDAPRPTDLVAVVRQLGRVQVDLTAAVAPSADLVLWSRLGAAYRPVDLETAIGNQALVEVLGMLRTAEDVALYRAEMNAWPGSGPPAEWQDYVRDWVDANNGCRLDILSRLRRDGPLAARDIPDTTVLAWRSSGWTNNRNVLRLMGFMEARGEVAVAGRQGRERLWDLADRIYPDDHTVPLAEALRIREQRQLQALGIVRTGETGEMAVVEGVRGKWRVDPAQLDRPFEGRTAILSPLDRLVFDRKRLLDLFEFDYQLEMYKPAAQRRWGYFALPILDGDRLVGKVDATADRVRGLLRVDAIHEDERFPKKRSRAVHAELESLAACLGLKADLPPL